MNANETAGRMIAERDARIKELEGELDQLQSRLDSALDDNLAIQELFDKYKQRGQEALNEMREAG